MSNKVANSMPSLMVLVNEFSGSLVEEATKWVTLVKITSHKLLIMR